MCAVGLGWTAAASAATTASVAGGTLTVTDDDSGGAPLTVTCQAGDVRVNDAPVGAGAACALITSIVIDSAIGGVGAPNALELAGAGPADGYTALTSTRVTAGYRDTVGGSPVRDVITSDYPALAIEGRAGDDDIDTRGAESIDAGPGADVIRPWNPAQMATAPTGGEGTDTFLLDYSAVTAVVFDVFIDDGSVTAAGLRRSFSSVEVIDARMPAGPQTLDGSGFSGRVRLHGGAGNDVLIGGQASDELVGGSGDDKLSGNSGKDVLTGDSGPGAPGQDTIAARDRERDEIDCGPGTPSDAVIADRIDDIAACETIDLPPLADPGSGPDRVAPLVRLGGASLRGSRLSFTVTCPGGESRCVGRAALRGSGRRGRKRAGTSLGRVSFDVRGGHSKRVVKRLSRRQRRRLGRLRATRLALRLDIRDAAGNRTQKAVRVALRLRR